MRVGSRPVAMAPMTEPSSTGVTMLGIENARFQTFLPSAVLS